MNYPAAELRGIKINFYLINPDAEHRGILLIKKQLKLPSTPQSGIFTPIKRKRRQVSWSKLRFYTLALYNPQNST
jgi:hypothetical protein